MEKCAKLTEIRSKEEIKRVDYSNRDPCGQLTNHQRSTVDKQLIRDSQYTLVSSEITK